MSPPERGAALVLVLVALATLMPLVLVLSELVWMRQRQVNAHRENQRGQAAVRGALDLAMARVGSGQVELPRGQEDVFEVDDPGSRRVHVRVRREPDAVVTVDGRVLGPEETSFLDLRRVGVDGEGRLVRQFRPLEVYLVEAECAARYPFAAVRLLAIVARVEDEGMVCLGLRYDRGYGQGILALR